jgi:hypothetical protein
VALPSLVTVEELASWLGEAIAEDDARATAVLRGASALVRSETGRAWLTAADPAALDTDTPAIDEDALEVAQLVVKQAAGRLWRNPAGLIQETTGPFSARYAEEAALGLYLTESEKGMLAGYGSGSASTGLWALRTSRSVSGASDIDTEFVDVDPAPADPLPFLSQSQPW